MCGIVGFLKKNNKIIMRLEDIMSDLLYMDTLRGEDSTGVLYSQKRGSGEASTVWNGWVKHVLPGPQFIKTKEYTDLWKMPNNNMFMVGHNRSATRGNVSVENAHPFVNGHIALVHNGSLHQHGSLGKKYYSVDSEAICAEISEGGLQSAVDKMSGAYSLVWHNREENTLNFLRNEHRPMFFVDTEDALFFGSEGAMLVSALSRNGVSPISIHETDPMHLHSFKIDALAQTVETLEVVKLEKKVEPPIVYPARSGGYYGRNAYWDEEYSTRSYVPYPPPASIRHREDKVPHELVQLGLGAPNGATVYMDTFPVTAVDPTFSAGSRIVFCLVNIRKLHPTGQMGFVDGELMLKKHEHIKITGHGDYHTLRMAEKGGMMLSATIARVIPGDGVLEVKVNDISVSQQEDPIFWGLYGSKPEPAEVVQ